jgi:hypothetical protein
VTTCASKVRKILTVEVGLASPSFGALFLAITRLVLASPILVLALIFQRPCLALTFMLFAGPIPWSLNMNPFGFGGLMGKRKRTGNRKIRNGGPTKERSGQNSRSGCDPC